MTEAFSEKKYTEGAQAGLLTEVEPSQELKLNEASSNFLNNPFKQVFMTEFILGSNKLKLYGNPVFMAEHSQFMKTSLEKFAVSKPPHELLSFGLVLERPMNLLWLYMNGFDEFEDNPQLSLTEFLHLYRLMNYFDIKVPNEFVSLVVRKFIVGSEEETRNTLKDAKNKDSFVRIVNSFISTELEVFFGFLTGKQLAELEVAGRVESGTFEPAPIRVDFQKVVLMKISRDYPEIAKSLNYIPVLVDEKYDTYAERKALLDKNNFIKSNPGWSLFYSFTGEIAGFARTYYNNFWQVELFIVEWGPDLIKIKSNVTQIVSSLNVFGPPPPRTMGFSPILAK